MISTTRESSPLPLHFLDLLKKKKKKIQQCHFILDQPCGSCCCVVATGSVHVHVEVGTKSDAAFPCFMEGEYIDEDRRIQGGALGGETTRNSKEQQKVCQNRLLFQSVHRLEQEDKTKQRKMKIKGRHLISYPCPCFLCS